MSKSASVEITVPMAIDVDGAPKSYGPDSSLALDHELNAHVGARASGEVVGYLLDDDGDPVVQGPNDPAPGFYVSETAYTDKANSNVRDPRRYVNAAEINYTLWAARARSAGVKKGDFCVVHSLRTLQTVYAIVGDAGNSSGAEGSLALLQRLGYGVKNGKSGGEDERKIVVRYFAGSNPDQRFFFAQADLEEVAVALDLDTDFSSYHPGNPGIMVRTAVGHTEADAEAFRVLPFAPLPGKAATPGYPGRLIRRDCTDAASVRLVQQRLRDLGYQEARDDCARGPLTVDGDFGPNTERAVELFQTRHSDLDANPLEIDGRVGIQTWGALFGRDAIASPLPAVVTPENLPAAADALLGKVLDFATSEIGVLEDPLGSNRGTRVVQYLASVGIPGGGEPWCAAFVYFSFKQSAAALGIANPVIRTASVLEHWTAARAKGVKVVLHDDALDDPRRVKPGMIFIISTGEGTGHTGLVQQVIGSRLVTIEGNTNDDGSREGIGVFRRTGRSIASINRGFIDYSA